MRRHVRHILYIAILTFTVVLVWVGLGLYHSRVASNVSPEVAELIEPISPQFDAEMLNILRSRKQIEYDLSEETGSFSEEFSTASAELDSDIVATNEAGFVFDE